MLPEDKPNPVPAWAAGIKAPAATATGAGSAPAAPGTALPPPEYGIGVAIYIHRAMADAFSTLAAHIAEMGDSVEARMSAIHAARKIAEQHSNTVAQLEESMR
jgi:hypothetical protein